ncbi:hypothetical protein [Virgibacillus ihumii]|uniref:hypothetical protein n=1 Tax=Virgibacillus ihumii TaxID=2686091 RepID=UPI00157C7EF0|nr:hypothetical protein [Virgibacillus ihumii]
MKFIIGKLCFILLFLITATMTAAEGTTKIPSQKQILEFDEDVTGDGRKESVTLKGIKFSMETDYLKDAWTEIQLANNKKWKIPYDGGYDPNLEFLDLNHDKVLDIFYQSKGQGGLHNHALHTLSNGELKEIQLPVQRYVKAHLTDGFELEVKLSPEQKPYTTNVKKQAADYIEKGIYNKQGRLLTDGSVIIEPISKYEPVFINKQKGYGLKSYQQINGTGKSDTIGTVQTTWYYENDKWLILKTKWTPSN